MDNCLWFSTAACFHDTVLILPWIYCMHIIIRAVIIMHLLIECHTCYMYCTEASAALVLHLPSNRLASKNAISACESNYYCVNKIILIVNIIISDVLSNDLCSISKKPTSILHCISGIILTSLELTQGIKFIKIKEMNFRFRTTLRFAEQVE